MRNGSGFSRLRHFASVASVVAVFGVGCAASTPAPCNCTCVPAAYGQEPYVAEERPSEPESSPSNAPAAPTATYGKAKNSIVLTEKQLLARYEGKPASSVQTGKATYYANSLAGRKTASGETYDPKAFTAAHRKLPFGTVVRVVRTDTNRYVYVTITDRGPFAGGNRIIDLSYIAAERLGMVRAGVVPVRVEVLR